jgi:hypothetical protein
VSVPSFERVAIRMMLTANVPVCAACFFTYCCTEQFNLDLEIHRVPRIANDILSHFIILKLLT